MIFYCDLKQMMRVCFCFFLAFGLEQTRTQIVSTCGELHSLYRNEHCCSSSKNTPLTTEYIGSDRVKTIELETIVTQGDVNFTKKALYTPPFSQPQKNVPLVIFLQGNDEWLRSKMHGWLDVETRVDQPLEYGLLEYNHYDEQGDVNTLGHAHPLLQTLRNLGKTLNTDALAMLQFLDMVPSSKEVVLIGHSIGTNLAFPVAYESMRAPDPTAGLANNVALAGTSKVRDFHPDIEKLSKRISRVGMMTPYDSSAFTSNVGLDVVLDEDRNGKPTKDFVIYLCAYDHYLPWNGFGINVLETSIVPQGINCTSACEDFPIDITSKRVYQYLQRHAVEITSEDFDFVPHFGTNPHLHAVNDLPNNKESTVTTVRYDNNVTGTVIIVGHRNFEAGIPQLSCIHGAPAQISNRLTLFMKRKLLGIDQP